MKTNSKTSLFLMELIIVILFFSIASVVCVQLFVNAYNTNEATKESSQGMVIVQNLAESFLGCDGDLNKVHELFEYSDLNGTGDTLTLQLDSDWNIVPYGDAHDYEADITISDESGSELKSNETGRGTLIDARIAVRSTSADAEITSQDIRHYIPYRLEDVN